MLPCSKSAPDLQSQQRERGPCAHNTQTCHRGICPYRHVAAGRGCALARYRGGNVARGRSNLCRLGRAEILANLCGKVDKLCKGSVVSNELQLVKDGEISQLTVLIRGAARAEQDARTDVVGQLT